MRSLVVIKYWEVFFFLILLPSSFKGQTVSQALQFEERIFDFGQIQEKDGIVSHDFKFKNISLNAVVLNNVTSGCGCVHFEFPEHPIKPNDTGKVKVFYNPSYRPGFFSKEIVVLSNNSRNYNRVWVKGTVIPSKHPISYNYPYDYGHGLWMNLEVMAFGTINNGEKKTLKLKYANDTDKDIRLFFIVLGGNTDIKFTSPHLVRAGKEGVMPVTYECSHSFSGMKKTLVYPVINGKASLKPLTVVCIGGE